MNTVRLPKVTLVICGLFLVCQLAIIFEDTASSNVFTAFAIVKPQFHGRTGLPYIKSDSDVGKYNLQIGFVLLDQAYVLTSDVLKYCWRHEKEITNSVENLLQTRLGIRVIFLSFELEACDPIPGPDGLHPSHILLASASSTMRVGSGIRAIQADTGVNSPSSLIPHGEYINQRLTPENRIYVNHVLETLRWPNENVLRRYERNAPSILTPVYLVYRIKATVNVPWSEKYKDCESSEHHTAARNFCLLHRKALRTQANSSAVWTSCIVTGFLPIPAAVGLNDASTSLRLRVSADFKTNSSEFLGITSEEATEVMNNAFMLISQNTDFNVVLPAQVIRVDQFLTCAKEASVCSPYANCVQTSTGFTCVCASLFKDAQPEVPGTKCQLDVSGIAVIAVIASLVLFGLILTVWTIIVKQRQRS